MMTTTYILGHSDEELRRLELQAEVLEPATRRLFHDLKLGEGMSVLDIGTGVGDVAMLAGSFVGPQGRVLGIDRNGAALERAQARAEQAMRNWIGFEEGELAGMQTGTFDLVVGRYVLMHQPDAASFLRDAASHVRPGGTLAFLVMAQTVDGRYSLPPVALYDQAVTDILTAFGKARADLDVGSRLVSLFAEADLQEPLLVADTPVGGASSVMPEWVARTRVNVQRGQANRPESWEALANAIRGEAAVCRSQLFGPNNVAAWVKIEKAGSGAPL